MESRIHLLMMTYNRLQYTKLALPKLLSDVNEEFSLTIWDNGSSDGTKEYLKTIRDQRIVDIIFCEHNRGQAYVTNKIWSETKAELVGKVDNDCLVTPGWTRILAKAHDDIKNLGVVGCWHFFPEEFDYERAKHKIQTFGRHQIFRHPWIDGSALLIKRKVYIEYGPCKNNEYLSGFWRRLALAGFINGFYYPLIIQDHLDDPMHPMCMIKNHENFQKHLEITQGLKAKRYKNHQGRVRWRQEILRNLLDDPFDPKYYNYVGWRSKLGRLKRRMQKVIAGKVSKK
jgi:glycosyltransferase involved in cell wall biosynthesis